jgi:UDP-glucose 4-epimerase
MYTLITGGAGYIGAHIAKQLYNTPRNLIILDNLSSGIISNCKYGIFIKADITNVNDIENTIFKKYKITSIIHVAGKAYVTESFQKIDDYYKTNVIGTINILNMMIKYNINNIIFSSSCAVYGNVDILPITETSLLKPISPYGMTKKLCEDIIINYSNTSGINYVILRYFNVAGNDFECDVGDNKNNLKRIIPTIIKKTLNNEVIEINGNTYNTVDGTCVRNYIHVNDLTIAHIKALNYLESEKQNLICNLGSDVNYSIIELIHIIEKHLNITIPFIFKDKIEGDPGIVYCNNTLAKNILNWSPIYNIDDMVKSYIIFLKKYSVNMQTDYSLCYNDKNYLGDTYMPGY